MSDLGLYVPVGAEGYNRRGSLVIDLASEGWLRDSSGQVIFKTAKGPLAITMILLKWQAMFLSCLFRDCAVTGFLSFVPVTFTSNTKMIEDDVFFPILVTISLDK